jgi:hypothetical protein
LFFLAVIVGRSSSFFLPLYSSKELSPLSNFFYFLDSLSIFFILVFSLFFILLSISSQYFLPKGPFRSS